MEAFSKFCRSVPTPLRYIATGAAGFAAGASITVGRQEFNSEVPTTASEQLKIDRRTLEKSEKKMRKLQRSAQERLHWKAVNREMLGLSPRLWMEVFDKKHRYAALLYGYWQRWELSDSNDDFWDWLDKGMGSLIDLPQAPQRFLDEWQVIYLRRDQQSLFRVIIEESTGRFLWEADGTPVTLPVPIRTPQNMTARERSVSGLIAERLSKTLRRDELLVAARREVEAAIASGEQPTTDRLRWIASPLVQEGLLCQLRDPYFEERHDAASTPLGHKHHWSMQRLPEELLPNLTWDHFLRAIDHDQGKEMDSPPETGEERLRGPGIFVLDSFGPLYCASKIRGVLQHSSFARGHCVQVAGGVTIKDGYLIELSPHSGHYQPGEEAITEMINNWTSRGVDFSKVHVKPYLKTAKG